MSERTEIEDGGPAFPRPASVGELEDGTEWVSMAQSGMSLRAWLAGQALAGYAGRPYAPVSKEVARLCVAHADAVLRRLNSKG